MNIKDEYILIAGFVFFVVLFVLILKKKSDLKKENNSVIPTTSSERKPDNSNTNSNIKQGVNFPLRKGSGYSGSSQEEKTAVKALQMLLNQKAKDKNNSMILNVDGAFGSKTEALLIDLTGIDFVSKENFQKWTGEGFLWTI